MTIIGYLAFILMGLTLGLTGGGGSILTVPILVYLLKIDPMLATAYSLFIVGSTALVGGFSYLKRGEVDLRKGLIFALPSFIGVYSIRSFVVPNLPSVILNIGSVSVSKELFVMIVFSTLMLVASTSMIRKKRVETNPSLSKKKENRILSIGFKGLFVGAVTGFVGAGGGFLIIPALVVLIGMPMRLAVGTSLFIIATNSLVGFIGDIQHQPYIDWKLLLISVAIALIGILAGTRYSSKVPEEKLKKGFGYFSLIMGTFILIDQITKL